MPCFTRPIQDDMNNQNKLVSIKLLHTFIWIFFNVVIFYLLFAVINNQINVWVWLGLASFGLEGIVLLIFKNFCPLTLWARKYSNSTAHNFDIYIPNWLAKYNKLIYSCILGLVILILIYQLLK
jgi:hypothetical protein